MKLWNVLALVATLATANQRGDARPADAVKELETAVRATLDPVLGYTAVEASAVAVAAIMTRNPALMVRCAGWLRDQYPDDLDAMRVAGMAFGYAGHRRPALELLDRLLEAGPDDRVRRLRARFERGDIRPPLFQSKPVRPK